MISQRVRENRRLKSLKLPKNIERLYKEGKCRDCAVVVTRMDFAKILGKFTKVKIQYESSSTPKSKKNSEVTPPNSNTRLKSNENGMVLIHRNAYSQHPVKELLTSKKPKVAQPPTPRPTSNVLKENNRLKKTPLTKVKISNNNNISSYNEEKQKNYPQSKKYGIVFVAPSSNNKNDIKSKTTLLDLLPFIDKNVLPNDEWCIDYLPRNEEPKNDKVYDRIAAELEDLMYNEKPAVKNDDNTESENKGDEFPSIMDILNDNSSDSTKPTDQSAPIDFKPSIESSDVEAMLLGKSTDISNELPSTPLEVDNPAMEVDNADVSNLIEDVAQLNAIEASEQEPNIKSPEPIVEDIKNPHSPSILDEALQKGIEEHLPALSATKLDVNQSVTINGSADTKSESTAESINADSNEDDESKIETKGSLPSNITHLIFKKSVNGECVKCVTCQKSLKYGIELEGKSVEFLGAPKLILSLEDLQVLLQIVDDTELKNLYVYH